MFEKVRYAFKTSRFRFWIYTGGTFVIGYTLGARNISDFYELQYYIYLFYFFILANIFIYGVNDLFDMSTDKNNPKKEEKETKLAKENIQDLKIILYFTTAISLVLMIFQENWIQRFVFFGFLFLSYFYSAKPLRFKGIPIFDFSSNMLYIMPGIFGYVLVADSLPPLLFVIAGFAHISAMHVFSAVPDIKYDRDAGISTTATVLGKKISLVLCTVFWSLLVIIVLYLVDFHPMSLLVLIYPLVPFSLLLFSRLKIEKIYWTLPYINTSLGGLLFLALIYMNIL